MATGSRTWIGAALGLALMARTASAGMSAGLEERLAATPPDTQVEVFVRYATQAVDQLPQDQLSVRERRLEVATFLRARHEEARKDVVARIAQAEEAGRASHVEHLWLVNASVLRATAEVLRDIARDPAVAEVRLPQLAVVISPQIDPADDDSLLPAVNGIRRVRAPQVWDLGDTGAGAVVAIIDTGVKANHRDLLGRWRGGGNSWRDTVGASSAPIDPNGHGTHVTGTILGGNVVGPNYIGVAYGAKYIACRAFDKDGVGLDTRIFSCLNWVADPDGNPWTDDVPDAVNGSWGVSAVRCDETFLGAVRALRALEIVPVFAAGNDRIASMPAAFPDSVAVGAVDRNNTVTESSGRGPSPCGGRPYPDLVAPGTQVRSAWKDGGRIALRGTSMATPHVTGTVALLRSHRPQLHAAEIEHILNATALDLGPPGPEETYGFGLVDAFRAFTCLDHGTYSGCGARCP